MNQNWEVIEKRVMFGECAICGKDVNSANVKTKLVDCPSQLLTASGKVRICDNHPS